MQPRFGSMTATAITTSKNKMPTRTAIMTSTMRTAAATGGQETPLPVQTTARCHTATPSLPSLPGRFGCYICCLNIITIVLLLLLLYHYYYILLLLLLVLFGDYICSYCIALGPRQKSVRTRKRTLEPWACRDEAMKLRRVIYE